MNPCICPRHRAPRKVAGLFVVFILALALLSGCGGGDKEGKGEENLVLATVGNKEITAAQYETSLKKMEAKELPKDDDGKPYDTAALEGKLEFLQVLINKELLVQKALQLGYDQDPQAEAARASLLAYHAGIALWNDVVGNPANSISEEELQAFYAKMGLVRTVNFVICNFEDDANEARAYAQSGADWQDVVDKYHDGSPSPSGKYEIKVPFGQYGPHFEDHVFNTPVGEVTPPVRTGAGYWVMRVVEETQREKPDLETAKAQILDITRNRKIGRAREDFKKQLHEEHKLFIDEDVLWTCYLGIPEGGIMDPETNEPRSRDSLEPLNVPLSELDKIFYTYEMGGELKEHTLGDYKGHFDKMSVFQRPKRSDMLGGLRQHIIDELERGMVDEAARTRGFYEHPDVLAQVNEKVEEVMVTKLYSDLVKFEERVTPEDLDAFWTEHKEEYNIPENRDGRLVVCLSEAEALKAQADAEAGKRWRGILKDYGTDKDNKSNAGRLVGVMSTGEGEIDKALFALNPGEVSAPFALENGRFGVVMLETIHPPKQIDKLEISEQLGQRIRNRRKEAAFQELLDKWALEFGVTRFEENMAGLKDWATLTAPENPENLVPRNDG
jgi:parvulin-like peptidyl-prolyl isomerase